MKAWVKGKKMHFDQEAWSLILSHAKRSHKTPRQVVIAAIKRGVKQREKQLAS